MTTTATTFKVIIAFLGFSVLYLGGSVDDKPTDLPRKAANVRLDDECLKKQRDTAYYKSGAIMTKIERNYGKAKK